MKKAAALQCTPGTKVPDDIENSKPLLIFGKPENRKNAEHLVWEKIIQKSGEDPSSFSQIHFRLVDFQTDSSKEGILVSRPSNKDANELYLYINIWG